MIERVGAVYVLAARREARTATVSRLGTPASPVTMVTDSSATDEQIHPSPMQAIEVVTV